MLTISGCIMQCMHKKAIIKDGIGACTSFSCKRIELTTLECQIDGGGGGTR